MPACHARDRTRRRMTGLAGLLAMAVHLAAYALAGAMPVAMAQAEAAAGPGEIVICTVHGPVRLDASALGLEPADEPPVLPERGPCDVAQHAAGMALAALAAPPAARAPGPAAICILCPDRMAAHLPAIDIRTAPPRAPPVTA